MKLPISQRLLACCGYIDPGARVADVGCDHGYLAIHLLQSGLASRVYASDIRPGPLDSARRNGEKFGVSEKIAYFLSDGVRDVPRDFDTLVCAGMGADVMISILEAAPWLRSNRCKLILQCQSKTPLLRKYLSETGWQIRRERVLKDGRFLYTVIEAVWSPSTVLTPGQCYVSPALLAAKDALLADYICRVTDHLELSVRNQADISQWEKDAYGELKRLREEMV